VENFRSVYPKNRQEPRTGQRTVRKLLRVPGKEVKPLNVFLPEGRTGREGNSAFRVASRIRLIRGTSADSGYSETKEPPLVQDTGNGNGEEI